MKPYKITFVVLAILLIVVLAARCGPTIWKLGLYRRPPLHLQLEDGKAVVRKLEEFKANHGRYPDRTEAVSILPGKLDQPDKLRDPFKWYYIPDESAFVIYRFTGLGQERLWYSNVPFDDGKPRWYLRHDGGEIRLLADP
jgi:hypothetical protein